MDKKQIKGYCTVAAFTVVLYFVLSHPERVGQVASASVRLLMPFFIGVVLAFVLNGVMETFEKHVFADLPRRFPRRASLVRPLSLISTYLLVLAALVVLGWTVVPQLGESAITLGRNIPAYLNSLAELAARFQHEWVLPPEFYEQLTGWLSGLADFLLNFIAEFVPYALNFAASFGGGIVTLVIGVIVSIHVLLTKEQLLSQARRLNRAFLPPKAADSIASAASVAAGTFRRYVSGQALDALIVGAVSVIGLSVLRFPYAVLIGVVMGVTNVIPFFGPFIGAVPGVLILLMADPIKAIWYILFVVIVQQVDGNIIAPKVIGGSVGLPPLWVLFAVTVGGNLFGIAGMILGVPLFATVYILLGRAVRARNV